MVMLCAQCGHPVSGDAGATGARHRVEGKRVTPSPGEIVVRRLSGSILLLLNVGPLVVQKISFGLLVVPVSLAMGAYLWFSRSYHPGADLFWVLLGWLVYACSLPLLGPAPTVLKLILFPADWSGSFPWTFLAFALGKIMVLACAIFLLVGDILARSRVAARPARRGLLGAIALVLAVGILLGLPLLRPVGPQLGNATGIGGAGAFNIRFEDARASFDAATGSWVYQITARNQLPERAEVTGITAQAFPAAGWAGIVSQKKLLAPPFGEDIRVSGADRTSEKVVVEPGATLTLEIVSGGPLASITLLQKTGRYDISFCSFTAGGATELEIVEALDPGVRVMLTDAFPPSPEAVKERFASGEPIYPQEQGLAKGTRYVFRILDSRGNVLVPLDGRPIARARMGTGMEGSGVFNTPEDPLPPGTYRVELIKVEGKKGFILSRAEFAVDAQR